MTKRDLISEILELMVSKGYFKEGDVDYKIYADLMKTDTKRQLLELKDQVERDVYIIF